MDRNTRFARNLECSSLIRVYHRGVNVYRILNAQIRIYEFDVTMHGAFCNRDCVIPRWNRVQIQFVFEYKNPILLQTKLNDK